MIPYEDCIPHNLLTAKLYAHGLNEETATFFYSYLKRTEERVKIDDVLFSLQILISGIPQGSILGPILFNIFLYDLLDVLTNSDICNFADDNTISVIAKNRDVLLKTLKSESEIAINWFKNNSMITNPVENLQFQLMLLQKSSTQNSIQ